MFNNYNGRRALQGKRSGGANEKKRIATRLYEEVEEGGESARGQRREMRLKKRGVGGGELRRRRFAVEETKANAKKERERESRKRRTRKGEGDGVVAEKGEGREEARGCWDLRERASQGRKKGGK
ncbi:hypothetical protein ALC56_12229 [Trachymyrmex septentrionalis]|uniref:Uncharacterized protein n=1 Tax=Trachymyrmex septentrionalis TaxID=34720 RepID=A0A195F030_9HYME|nr:hypothetical protein ALC56_12229 [Trachymyrmex septentrionalis]